MASPSASSATTISPFLSDVALLDDHVIAFEGFRSIIESPRTCSANGPEPSKSEGDIQRVLLLDGFDGATCGDAAGER